MGRHVKVTVAKATLDQILERCAGADPEGAVALELCAELPGLSISGARRLAMEIWRAYLQDGRAARTLRHEMNIDGRLGR
jgi:hypothetical protein